MFELVVTFFNLSISDLPISDFKLAKSIFLANFNVSTPVAFSKSAFFLDDETNQKQIDLIMHSSINTKRHLNRIRLHLNGYGKSTFIRNIRNYVTNFK